MAWLLANALPFVLKHWKALLLALLVSIIVGSLWRHIANDNQRELDLMAAQGALAAEQARYDELAAKLADADRAAKAAIKANEDAAKAAEKRLAAREKFWRERYRNDPEARAWGAERVPAGVLDGLRH